MLLSSMCTFIVVWIDGGFLLLRLPRRSQHEGLRFRMSSISGLGLSRPGASFLFRLFLGLSISSLFSIRCTCLRLLITSHLSLLGFR